MEHVEETPQGTEETVEQIKETQEAQLKEAKKQQQEQVEMLVQVLTDTAPLFKEYVPKAIRTELDYELLNMGTPEFKRVAHSVIGITTEITELTTATNEANVKEELGDIFWYLAIADDILNFMDSLELTPESISTIMSGEEKEYTVDVLDIVKKTMFYGEEFNPETCVKPFQSMFIGTVINSLRVSMDISDILDTNLKKLYVRYPDKFTSELAELRDLDAEREALESTEDTQA